MPGPPDCGFGGAVNSGGAPRQLTHDSCHLMHTRVSPDGRWIACTRIVIVKADQVPSALVSCRRRIIEAAT
jgi:hypothetical protein